MMQSMPIAYHGNKRIVVSVGDTFKWWDGTSWEIVRYLGSRMYSPSGMGGTPILLCKQTGGEPELYARYLRDDGTVEWCGDSVAGAIAGTIR